MYLLPSILKDTAVIKKYCKMFIYSSSIIDGLYIINHNSYIANNSIKPNSNPLPLKRNIPFTNEAYLWHFCLGHINPNRI